MQTTRGSHIHRIRQVASSIFGFTQDYFNIEYDRSSLPEFQKLLGVTISPGGKKYPLFPPILYPDGVPNKDVLFLNPVVGDVSTFIFSRSLPSPAPVQILKVILFGPSSLRPRKRRSGPTPNGMRWGIQEANAGMIAFAAIIVSRIKYRLLKITQQRWSLGSLPVVTR